MACSPKCPLNKATTVSRKENLLRNIMAASLWGLIQMASVARQKHSQGSVKKEKLIQAWVRAAEMGKQENKEGLIG